MRALTRVSDETASSKLFPSNREILDQALETAARALRAAFGNGKREYPMQDRTSFMKAAKSLGLTFPLNVLARTDEVMEKGGGFCCTA